MRSKLNTATVLMLCTFGPPFLMSKLFPPPSDAVLIALMALSFVIACLVLFGDRILSLKAGIAEVTLAAKQVETVGESVVLAAKNVEAAGATFTLAAEQWKSLADSTTRTLNAQLQAKQKEAELTTTLLGSIQHSAEALEKRKV